MASVMKLVLAFAVSHLFGSTAFAKDPNSLGYSEMIMANGAYVLSLDGTGEYGGTVHVDENGLVTMLDPRHPFIVGAPVEDTHGVIKFLSDEDVKHGMIRMHAGSHLTFALMGADILFVKPNGEHKRIHLLPWSAMPASEFRVLRSEFRVVGGRHYHVFAVTTNKMNDEGVAIMVDENLRSTEPVTLSIKELEDGDKLFSNLIHDLVEKGLTSGILQRDVLYSDESVRAKFPNGLTLPPRTIAASELKKPKQHLLSKTEETPIGGTLTDVEVPDVQGKPVSALALIKPFTTNLTEKFKTKALTGMNADQSIRRRLLEVLASREMSNAVVVGFPGVGKTTEILILANDLAAGRGPDFLKGYTVLSINARSIESGGSYVGAIATKITAILALAKINKIILVIDEIHALKGVGTHSTQPFDITQQLKEALADGTLKVIGMSTQKEFLQAFASDRAFMERFTMIEKQEPTGTALREAIMGWVNNHGLNPPSSIILERAIQITNDFDGIGAQPRKTTRLLDRVYARIRLGPLPNMSPTLPDLEAVAAEHLAYDRALSDKSLAKLRLQALVAHLNREVVGQDEVKKVFRDNTRTYLAGLHDRNKPLMQVVLTGPEGQGKTFVAKEYARGMELPFEVIEMNQFRNGAYHGKGPLALAAAAIARNSRTVLIFDEIEKCPIELQEQLLSALNEGRTTVQRELYPGHIVTETVDFRNTVIIMTANAGAAALSTKTPVGFMGRARDGLSSGELRTLAINGNISRLIIDRSDDIIAMRPLTQEKFREAVSKHLGDVIDDMRMRGFTVSVRNADAYVDAIVSEWIEGMSNREIARLIRPLRQTVAAIELDSPEKKAPIELEYRDGELIPVGLCEQNLLAQH